MLLLRASIIGLLTAALHLPPMFDFSRVFEVMSRWGAATPLVCALEAACGRVRPFLNQFCMFRVRNQL